MKVVFIAIPVILCNKNNKKIFKIKPYFKTISAKSNKNSKKANKCEESEPQFANNNQETIDTNESLNKNDLKLKPKKLSFEEILSKDKKQINKNIDLKMKKKNLQMSHKCDNKAANIVGNGTQQTLTKQKKVCLLLIRISDSY